MNTVDEMGITTDWVPFEQYGSYYRLEGGTLMQSPMLKNGSRAVEYCEVDWNNISYEDQAECVRIVAELVATANDKFKEYRNEQ